MASDGGRLRDRISGARRSGARGRTLKLVFVTQSLDPKHAVLAQTLDLVGALALRWDEVAVVTRENDWKSAPDNVTAHTFDAPSRIGRVVGFERALADAAASADAIFVHMVPEFLDLAAPLARIRRLPLILWYTHWNVGRALKLAAHLADAIVSVDTTSFPIASPKLRPIGHAIDTEVFTPVDTESDGPFHFLAVGRTARWKGLATLLDAFATVDGTLEIRGPSLTDDEVEHRAELQGRIEGDERLAGRVELLPAVPRQEIPALLRSADAVVSPNEPRFGSTLDKAVFEAAACARPVVSTNRHFAPLLDQVPLQLLAPPADPAALSVVLSRLAGAPRAERVATGAELRRRVVEHHSLGHWADAVTSLIREVRSRRGTAG